MLICLKNKTLKSIVLNATNEFTHIVMYKNVFTFFAKDYILQR